MTASCNKDTNTKRKRVLVSTDKKLEPIKRLNAEQSIKKIASELNVGKITVGDWKRNKR